MYCPFCDPQVISDQTLYESDCVRVIHNIRPANKGQCVVVPKRHVSTVRDLTKCELIDLIVTSQTISEKFNRYLQPEGFNYGFNEGIYAGQTVEHFHFHILPRINGDKNILPQYHLFHRDPKIKKNLLPDELRQCVDEMKKILL